jgi:hypothetical protein
MIIAKLLTKKRQLVNRLEEADLRPDERAEHECELTKIDTALDLLEPAISKQRQQDGVEATARRGRGTGTQKSPSPDRRSLPDPQHALGVVRWRHKVRRNG